MPTFTETIPLDTMRGKEKEEIEGEPEHGIKKFWTNHSDSTFLYLCRESSTML
jgi:hypothetical protein